MTKLLYNKTALRQNPLYKVKFPMAFITLLRPDCWKRTLLASVRQNPLYDKTPLRQNPLYKVKFPRAFITLFLRGTL